MTKTHHCLDLNFKQMPCWEVHRALLLIVSSTRFHFWSIIPFVARLFNYTTPWLNILWLPLFQQSTTSYSCKLFSIIFLFAHKSLSSFIGKKQVFEEGKRKIEPQNAPVSLTLFNEAPAVRHRRLNPPHSNICQPKDRSISVGQCHQANTDWNNNS